MSIVRVGLGESDKFAEGYEAIFGKNGKKDEEKASNAEAPPESDKPARKLKKVEQK